MADFQLSDIDGGGYGVLIALAALVVLSVCTPYLYTLLRRREDADDDPGGAGGRGLGAFGGAQGGGVTPKQFADLQARVRALEDEVAALKGNRPEDDGQEEEQPTEEHPAEKKKKKSRHVPPPPAGDLVAGAHVDDFRRLYNDGMTDLGRRQEFADTYHPIRVGTSNARERVRNPRLDPEFVTASDGDFYAVDFRELGDGRHLVVPRHDLVFRESIYGPGAMGFVFECRNYDPQARSAEFVLVRPAVFAPGDDKCWTLRQKGVLELTRAE